MTMFIVPFSIVMVGYAFVMLKFLQDSDREAKLLFIGQIAALIVAFIAFLMFLFPFRFGLITGDGDDLIRIGIAGTAWAFSMFYNLGIVWKLHTKQK